MPHQCTNCQKTFEDGNKEILDGCTDCGGNKFQYVSEDALETTEPLQPTSEEPETKEKTNSETQDTQKPTPEDNSNDVLETDVGDEELERVRQELEEQFESIVIKEPGKYQINIEKLYYQQDHIVSLRQDGKYVIQMPESES